MANQICWSEPTWRQEREEKTYEDTQPHKECSWALVTGFLTAKILGEQQESPTVMTRSVVHLRVLIPAPTDGETEAFSMFPYLVKSADKRLSPNLEDLIAHIHKCSRK